MHVLHPFANGGKNTFHIHAMVVCGKGIQHTQIDLELLFQQLYQGSIDDGFFVTGSDDVVCARLPQDIHRHQQYRGIAGHDTLVVLVPFQHTDGEEQRVRTILFQRVPGGTVNELHGCSQLRLTEIRHQSVIPLHLLAHHFLQVGSLQM